MKTSLSFVNTDERFRRLALCQPTRYRVTYLFLSLPSFLFSQAHSPPLSRSSFGGERNRREALLTGWIGQEWRSNYSITARVPYLSHSFPSSSLVTSFPLTPKGSSDQRFLSEPIPFLTPYTSTSNDPFATRAISFVHGGITPEYLETLTSSSSTKAPISEINRIGSEIMQSLLDSPGAPMSLPRGATTEQRYFWSEKGPMWNREWAMLEEEEICQRVERACEMMGVRRLVMGHTPHFEGILSRCQGKILLIDTGARFSLSLFSTVTN